VVAAVSERPQGHALTALGRATIARDGRVTCGRDGAALLRVERCRDFGLERRRVVFACGHSLYPDPPTPTREAREARGPSTRVCGDCGEDFTPPPGTPHALKCEACVSAGQRRYGRATVAS
jgi:hypothetical protein